ncbi:MAG TPA: ATP-binding protein [Streptosporangiaceae bacterium]
MQNFADDLPAACGAARRAGEPWAVELDTWSLPARAAAVGRARELLRAALAALGFDAETTGDGVLMVSELATNALRHARPPYEMRLRRDDRALTCEIADASPVLPALPRRAGPAHQALDGIAGTALPDLREAGRGLEIVKHLSGGRCGTWPTVLRATGAAVCGKSVWFSLDLP